MEEFVKDLQEKQKQKDKNNINEKEENKQKLKNDSVNLDNSLEDKEAEVLNLDNSENYKADFSFKIIVIGNSFVGKSSIVERAAKNKFAEDYSATIGFDYSSFFVKYEDKIIKLQIWDTCGQEIFQSLITNFYKNSSLAIMVYAINDRESFHNLDSWLKELKKESSPDAKVILIGNKNDLESERQVTYEEGEQYCKDYNFISFYETSAKTGFNSQKVFIKAAITLYKELLKYKERNSGTEDESDNKPKSEKLSNPPRQKSGCC